MYRILYPSSCLSGRSGGFRVLAVVNSAALHTGAGGGVCIELAEKVVQVFREHCTENPNEIFGQPNIFFDFGYKREF